MRNLIFFFCNHVIKAEFRDSFPESSNSELVTAIPTHHDMLWIDDMDRSRISKWGPGWLEYSGHRPKLGAFTHQIHKFISLHLLLCCLYKWIIYFGTICVMLSTIQRARINSLLNSVVQMDGTQIIKSQKIRSCEEILLWHCWIVTP